MNSGEEAAPAEAQAGFLEEVAGEEETWRVRKSLEVHKELLTGSGEGQEGPLRGLELGR